MINHYLVMTSLSTLGRDVESLQELMLLHYIETSLRGCMNRHYNT
jgi:hypothetical protein